MGLVLGFGLIAALCGTGLAVVCFGETQRLRRLGRRRPAVCFAVGAALCAALALGGAWLVWGMIDAFI